MWWWVRRKWRLCWSPTYPDQMIPQRAGPTAWVKLPRHSERLLVFPKACWGAALLIKILALIRLKLNDVDQKTMHRITAGKTQKRVCVRPCKSGKLYRYGTPSSAVVARIKPKDPMHATRNVPNRFVNGARMNVITMIWLIPWLAITIAHSFGVKPRPPNLRSLVAHIGASSVK